MRMDYSKRNVTRQTKCTHRQAFGGETRGKETAWETDVDGRIILRWIFREWDVEVLTGSSWVRIGTGGGPL